MQLTDKFNWSFFDFIIAGVMLSITGIAIGFVIKKIKNYKSRKVFIIIILMIFFSIWAELGVGIFGTKLSGDQIFVFNLNKKKPKHVQMIFVFKIQIKIKNDENCNIC